MEEEEKKAARACPLESGMSPGQDSDEERAGQRRGKGSLGDSLEESGSLM